MSEKITEARDDIIQPITITYKGEETYTLDFSRESAVFAQDKGLNLSEIETKPGIVIPNLFFFAMRMHHKNLAKNQVDKLREKLFPNGIPASVIERLTQLYQQASFVNLIEIDEDETKNSDTVVEM